MATLRRTLSTTRAPNPKTRSMRLASGLLFALLTCTYSYFTGCGTGPYEQCLAQADCPGQQVCTEGRCTTPKPPTPRNEPTPDATTEPAPDNLGPEPSPKPEVRPEPTPEPQPEPTPEPQPGCKANSDCQASEVCQQGKCVPGPTACVPARFSGELVHPEGVALRRLTMRPDGKVFSVYSGNLLRLHDVATGRLVQGLFIPTSDRVMRIFWSADSQQFATVAQKETLIWSADRTKVMHRITGNTSEFSPDGKQLLVLTQDKKSIEYYDVQTGQKTSTKALEMSQSMQWVGGHFAPGGAHLVGYHAFKEVVIWDAATAKELKRITVQAKGSYFGVEGPLSSDLFALQLRETTDTETAIFSISQGKKIAALPGAIQQENMSTDGKQIFFFDGKEIKSVELSAPTTFTSTTISVLSGVYGLLLDPTGTRVWLATLQKNPGALFGYDAKTYQYAANVEPLGEADVSVRFHPTKDMILTTSQDGMTKTWDPADIPRLGKPSLASVNVYPYTEPYKQYKTGLVVDRSWQSALSYDSGRLVVRDTATGKERHQLTPQTIQGTQTHHFGFALNGTWLIGLLHGSALQSWDLSTGQSAATKDTTNGQYKATFLGIHPQSGIVATKLLTAQYTETVTLWDPKTLQARWSFPYDGYIWSIAMAPTKPWIAILDRRRKVHVIDLTSGKEIASLDVSSGNGAMVFGPQSKHLAVRGGVKVEIFDTTTWTRQQELSASSRVFALDPTESLIAIATVGGDVELYDIKSGTIQGTLISKDTSKNINDLAFSPDGKRLAFTSAKTGRVQLWSCSE